MLFLAKHLLLISKVTGQALSLLFTVSSSVVLPSIKAPEKRGCSQTSMHLLQKVHSPKLKSIFWKTVFIFYDDFTITAGYAVLALGAA